MKDNSVRNGVLFVIIIFGLITSVFAIHKYRQSGKPYGIANLQDMEPEKTIYEKNNHPEYPKTIIEIPEHQGYLI